jgi:hypothetical protein
MAYEATSVVHNKMFPVKFNFQNLTVNALGNETNIVTGYYYEFIIYDNTKVYNSADFILYDKIGYDFCYNTTKYYLKISHFLGLCVDYCPYLFYTPSYTTTSDTLYYKYMDFIYS